MTQKNKTNLPWLEPAYEKLRAKGRANRETVLRVLRGLEQPVTVTEIAAALNDRLDQSSVRHALAALAEDSLVLHRKETATERSLRFDGRQPVSVPAELYWPADRGPVADRTTAEAVPGVVLTGPLQPRGRKPGSKVVKRRATHVAGRSVTTLDLNAASLDVLVEKLVEARHASLIAENNELRETVRRVRGLVREVLDTDGK